jgi:hypothetical protein
MACSLRLLSCLFASGPLVLIFGWEQAGTKERCQPPLLYLHQMVHPSSLVSLFKGWAGRSSNARVERGPYDSLYIPVEEWPGCPLLRASSDHCFIVGALRARRAPGRFLPHPSPLERCTSIEDHQAPSRSLLGLYSSYAASFRSVLHRFAHR